MLINKMETKGNKYVDEKLRKIIKRWHTGKELYIDDESSLRYDLDLDSLMIMETCIECENKFKVKITNIEIVRCKTYGDLKNLIERKLV